MPSPTPNPLTVLFTIIAMITLLVMAHTLQETYSDDKVNAARSIGNAMEFMVAVAASFVVLPALIIGLELLVFTTT